MGGCQIHFTVSSCARPPRLAQSRPRVSRARQGRPFCSSQGRLFGSGGLFISSSFCCRLFLPWQASGEGPEALEKWALSWAGPPGGLGPRQLLGHLSFWPSRLERPVGSSAQISLFQNKKQAADGVLKEHLLPGVSRFQNMAKNRLWALGPLCSRGHATGSIPGTRAPRAQDVWAVGGGWVKREGERRR